jgi:hypothetical protein
MEVNIKRRYPRQVEPSMRVWSGSVQGLGGAHGLRNFAKRRYAARFRWMSTRVQRQPGSLEVYAVSYEGALYSHSGYCEKLRTSVPRAFS